MSVTHWLIVALVVLVLFGGSRLGEMGKGLGEGIKNFKKGLADEDKPPADPPQSTTTDAKVIDEKQHKS
jgi:sec-independent protein translocase protein TatA